MKKKLKIIIPIIIVILLLIAGAVVFALNYKMPKEKMLKVAKDFSSEEFSKDLYENKNRLLEKYPKNIYKFDIFIEEFEENGIKCYIENEFKKPDGTTFGLGNTHIYLKANLSEEEINKLQKNQRIQIVGKIDEIEFKKETHNLGVPIDVELIIMNLKDVYLVKDIFDVTGYVRIPTSDYSFIGPGGQRSWIIRDIKDWKCYIEDDKEYKYDITAFGTEKKFNTDKGEPSVIAGQSVLAGDLVTITGKFIEDSVKIYEVKDLQKLVKTEK